MDSLGGEWSNLGEKCFHCVSLYSMYIYILFVGKCGRITFLPNGGWIVTQCFKSLFLI